MTDKELVEKWVGEIVDIIPDPRVTSEQMIEVIAFDLKIAEKQTVGFAFTKRTERFLSLGMVKIKDQELGILERDFVCYVPELEDLH